jgi:hypothetical protein
VATQWDRACCGHGWQGDSAVPLLQKRCELSECSRGADVRAEGDLAGSDKSQEASEHGRVFVVADELDLLGAVARQCVSVGEHLTGISDQDTRFQTYLAE